MPAAARSPSNPGLKRELRFSAYETTGRVAVDGLGQTEMLDRSWRGALKFIFHLVVIVGSIYLTYGWLTISDIRSAAVSRGMDPEIVFEELARQSKITVTEGGYKVSKPSGFLSRLRGSVVKIKISNEYRSSEDSEEPVEGDVESGPKIALQGRAIDSVEYMPLFVFLVLSPNVLNFLFCIGVGSLIGYVIVLVQLLRDEPLAPRYALLRPLVGGCAAGILFLIVISGGSLFWAGAQEVNGISVGILSTIGALYCERIRSILNLIAGNH